MPIFLSILFIILVSLTMTLFSEKLLISNRGISGLMSNLIKKSWTDSTLCAGIVPLLPEPKMFLHARRSNSKLQFFQKNYESTRYPLIRGYDIWLGNFNENQAVHSDAFITILVWTSIDIKSEASFYFSFKS